MRNTDGPPQGDASRGPERSPSAGAAETSFDAFGQAPPRESLKGHAAMLTSMVAHISGFVVYKALAETLPAAQTVGTQLVIGAGLLWLFAIATRQRLRLHGPLWRIALLGCLAPASILLIMAHATQHTSATNATIIFGLAPVTLPVLGWLILGERLRASVMAGALIAFSGIVLIVWRRAGLGAGEPLGDALVFLAVICVCATHLSGRRVNQHFSNAVMVTTYQVTVSAFLVTGVMLLAAPDVAPLEAADGATWLKLFYLALISIVLNYLTYNFALRRLPVARTGLYVALSPAIGTILAISFLGETVRWLQVLGIVVVMAGVSLPGLVPEGALSRALGRGSRRARRRE